MSLTLKEKAAQHMDQERKPFALTFEGALFFHCTPPCEPRKKIKERELENAQHELNVLSKT